MSQVSPVILLLSIWATAGDAPAFAAAEGRPVAAAGIARMVKLGERPTLDGKLDDPCWNKAVLLPRFTARGRPVKAETYAFVFYDDSSLYVGVHCEEPFVAKIQKRYTDRDDPIWADDCVELFIDSNRDRTSYFHFIANAVDGRADAFNASPSSIKTGMRYDLDWTSKSFIGPDFWSVEFVVPFRSLNLPARESHDIGFTICRERYPDNEYCSWRGWFHRPKDFGILKGIRLTRRSNPIHCTQLDFGEGLWGDNEFCAELAGLADNRGYTLKLALLGAGRLLDSRRQRLDLPEGSRQRVVQRYRVPPQSRISGSCALRVTLHAGEAAGPPVLALTKKFKLQSEAVAQFSLDRAAYYLGDAAAEVRVRCFLSRITVREGLLFSVSVENDAGQEAYAQSGERLNSQHYTHRVPLAPIPEGWYRVHVQLSDRNSRAPLAKAALTLRKVCGPFERRSR